MLKKTEEEKRVEAVAEFVKKLSIEKEAKLLALSEERVGSVCPFTRSVCIGNKCTIWGSGIEVYRGEKKFVLPGGCLFRWSLVKNSGDEFIVPKATPPMLIEQG